MGKLPKTQHTHGHNAKSQPNPILKACTDKKTGEDKVLYKKSEKGKGYS